MSAAPHLLILRHSVLDGAGYLDDYFRSRGWRIDTVDPLYDDLGAIDPLAADLVLPLGSGLSVYDEPLFPFITAERRLLQQRIEADRPLLGICFGAQILASALGARVYRAPKPEVGWLPLTLTPEGDASVMRHLSPELAPAVMHWHQDTFDLPDGTQRLARSALCDNQAFSRGKTLLAFQFHPEMTVRGIEAWLAESSFTAETRAARVAEIRADSVRWQPAVQAQTMRALDEWMAGWSR